MRSQVLSEINEKNEFNQISIAGLGNNIQLKVSSENSLKVIDISADKLKD